MFTKHPLPIIVSLLMISIPIVSCAAQSLSINDTGYFESSTLNVMVFDDYYPEGHQGGISIIQHGDRIATNGDIRLSRDPGQWQPAPKKLDRTVDTTHARIITDLQFPDDSKTMKGFNPMPDPGCTFTYHIEVNGIKNGVEVLVHFDEAVPAELEGKVRFNLEIFPTHVFGKSFLMDETTGIFPRQANGALDYDDTHHRLEIAPLATGHHLTIAPEDPKHCLTIVSEDREMELLDGRGIHNNGWFVLSSTLPTGGTRNALRWQIIGHPNPSWVQPTTLLVSQVGYHPKQQKLAYLECPKNTSPASIDAILEKYQPETGWQTVMMEKPSEWGGFLRYVYGVFDFSRIEASGLYRIRYGNTESHAFQISDKVYQRHVWQPTLEYFLPVQMCHMRVNEKYRVWHDLCHQDDALMAPVNITHFDGYAQGPDTLTHYQPFDPVPGLDRGGWHDAGDYDLRVESQAGTVYALALAYELFQPTIDQTLVDQKNHRVEIHQPDHKNDLLQQIEHGLLTILGGYDNLGRLYRGIITPSLRQYVMLGDASAMSDGQVLRQVSPKARVEGIWYQKVTNAETARMDPHEQEDKFEYIEPKLDDRLVFTEENPYRSLEVAAALACASRVMHSYDPSLADHSLEVAEALWQLYHNTDDERLWPSKAQAALELAKATGDANYKAFLLDHRDAILAPFARSGHIAAMAVGAIAGCVFYRSSHHRCTGVSYGTKGAAGSNTIWGALPAQNLGRRMEDSEIWSTAVLPASDLAQPFPTRKPPAGPQFHIGMSSWAQWCLICFWSGIKVGVDRLRCKPG